MTSAVALISFLSKEEIRKPEDEHLNQSTHYLIANKKFTFSYGGANADCSTLRIMINGKIIYDDETLSQFGSSAVKVIAKTLQLQGLDKQLVIGLITTLYNDSDLLY